MCLLLITIFYIRNSKTFNAVMLKEIIPKLHISRYPRLHSRVPSSLLEAGGGAAQWIGRRNTAGMTGE